MVEERIEEKVEEIKLEKVEDVIKELERDLREAHFLFRMFSQITRRRGFNSEEKVFIKDHLEFLSDGQDLIKNTLFKIHSISTEETKH